MLSRLSLHRLSLMVSLRSVERERAFAMLSSMLLDGAFNEVLKKEDVVGCFFSRCHLLTETGVPQQSTLLRQKTWTQTKAPTG